MAEPSDDRVELTELDVITRYSLAVRAATADREELIAALRADLQWLEGGRRGALAAPRAATTARAAAAKASAKAPAKSSTRKTTTSRASTRRAR
ncbi:MAG TPA: hypothetical protein VFT62_05865 [Mycobacteriales bacterium]|nr:hypothetical protein [Mycobacteriales bacterium]